MKIALVGQPNSGKSTVFNAVAGYRSLTSNFAGTTVEYTRGQARVAGAVLEIIDLPGLYSLMPTSAVEEVSRNFLLAGDWDVIVNVVDASQMARSLELTLELLDLESPMVVCLNMMDEAARKGMTIDTHTLELALGVPVVEAIGGRGRGIVETFRMAQRVVAEGKRSQPFVYAPELENILKNLAEKVAASTTGQPTQHRRSTLPPVLPARISFDAAGSCGAGHCHSGCCESSADRNAKAETRTSLPPDRNSTLETRNSKLQTRNLPTGPNEFRTSSPRVARGAGAQKESTQLVGTSPAAGVAVAERSTLTGVEAASLTEAERACLPGAVPASLLVAESASLPGAIDGNWATETAQPLGHAADLAMARPLGNTAVLTMTSPLGNNANLAAAPSQFAVASGATPITAFPPARFRALQLVQSKPGERRIPDSGFRIPEPEVRSPESEVRSPEPDARSPQSEGQNPRSERPSTDARHSSPITRHCSPDFGLRTSDTGLDSSDPGLRTSDFGLDSPDSGLRTSDLGLDSSDSGLRTSDFGLGFVAAAQAEITARTGQPADAAVSAARHAACLTLFECVAKVARPKADWRERVDHVAMHPIWGYAVLMGVFLGFFRLIFDVGKLGEDRILSVFDAVVAVLTQHMNPQGPLFAASKGAVLGTAGAVAIVLPYLLPFLVGLAILEDIGYLSRVGYLMDAAMHRLGLHGTATLPILVGYGCSVPAVMATRILTTRRDRFIAAFLAVLVPCSARMTVIFALVGFYLGANYALGIYVLNIIIVALSGHVLARIWPEISPGMLMEVPAYRVPGIKVVAFKTWWRLREFVLVAFPLLVVGSVVLSLVDFYGWQHGINAALSPFTALLGLPRSVGLTLIFGVLRKELSLLMLMQALGTTHVLGAMTTAQILIFTLFVTFYLPCMATLASMMRELGWRLTLAASTALLALAIVVSLAARGVFLLF